MFRRDKKTKLTLEVRYDPRFTDPAALAASIDQLIRDSDLAHRTAQGRPEVLPAVVADDVILVLTSATKGTPELKLIVADLASSVSIRSVDAAGKLITESSLRYENNKLKLVAFSNIGEDPCVDVVLCDDVKKAMEVSPDAG